MIPNLNIFGKIITPYMICVLLGVFIAGPISIKQTKKEDETEYLVTMLFSAIGVYLGGKLLYGLTNFDYIIDMISGKMAFSFRNLQIIFGGSVFYGGMIGGLLTALIYCKIKKISFSYYSDQMSLFIPLFHAFGRIGCFLSGCCYGCESDIGFIYRYSMIESANNVRRFPIQLLESFGNLLIFLLLFYLFKHGILKSKLLYLYFTLYSVLRFTDEFFRGDEYRGFLWIFSTSQWISIALFIFGMIMLIRKPKKSDNIKKNPSL